MPWTPEVRGRWDATGAVGEDSRTVATARTLVERSREEFERDTLGLAHRVRAATGAPSVAIAPFAGTRIAGFRELDLDGLVMVDWSRPGTDAEVRRALADARFWHQQRSIKGGESSKDVLSSPAAAQILAKLELELGVTEVTVSRFAQPGDSPNVAMGTVSEKDRAFVTQFDFIRAGKPCSIAFVSWEITGDNVVPGREPLPNTLLRRLRPDGFAWVYVAADGVGFFSRDQKNGLQGASRTLVRDLAPGGAVLLDDPHASAYVEGGQEIAGIQMLRGRARLEPFGVREIGSLRPPASVYGYTGLDARDRVRVYQKPGTAASTRRTAIDTSMLTRIDSTTYRVRAL